MRHPVAVIFAPILVSLFIFLGMFILRVELDHFHTDGVLAFAYYVLTIVLVVINYPD